MKNNSFVLLISLILLFASCQKLNNPTEAEDNPIDLKEQLLSKLKESIKANPSLKKIIVPINEKVDGFFADLKFNRIALRTH